MNNQNESKLFSQSNDDLMKEKRLHGHVGGAEERRGHQRHHRPAYPQGRRQRLR